jgi:ribokinase
VSSARRRYDLAGIGSMVVDQIFRVPRFGGAEEKVLLEARGGEPLVRTTVGGVALNHLAWARVMGLRVAIFGVQADDPEGRFLREGIDRLGIERHIDLGGSASSFAQVYVDARGERAIYMARGATGELTPDHIDLSFLPVIESSAVVSSEISQVPLAAVRRVFERAHAAGARTVLDLDVPRSDAVPALGSDEEFEAVLGLADILKPSQGALGWLDDAASPGDAAGELAQRYGCALVAVTLGAEGALVWSAEGTSRAPAASVEVRDTTGAGDAFLGGFVAGLSRGLDPAEAALLGNACGAVCCEQLGAFPEDPEDCRKRALAHFRALGGPELAFPAEGGT